MAWDKLTVTYTLRNARVVVILDEGGAVVETGDVDYTEGRFATTTGEAQTPLLHPEWAFEVAGRGEPISSVMVEARIVIDGETEDGKLEIRGDGLFGYDQDGNFEGSFHKSPAMLLDSLPRRGREEAAKDEDETEFFTHVEPREPEQFVRACRRYEPLG